MKEELKQMAGDVAQQAISNPKSATAIGLLANFNAWYVEYGSAILQFLTSLFGLILILVLIKYHWANGRKVQMEIAKEERENEEAKKKLQNISPPGDE